jgi:hypothetical protein
MPFVFLSLISFDSDFLRTFLCLCPINFLHCKENPIHVLTEKKLRGLSPNFHILVSVSDL